MLNTMDKFDILVSLILSWLHLCLFNFHRNVSVSHWFVYSSDMRSWDFFFTSKTIQSEITRPARWWGCHKTTSKIQNNKFQDKKKRKKNIWLTMFSSKNIDIHVTSFYHSWKFVFFREKWVIKNRSHLT